MATETWYRGESFPHDAFKAALREAGAEFLPLAGEWEVLRYRLEDRLGIVYRNKKGRITPSGAAGQHFANFSTGRDLASSFGEMKRARRAALMDASPQLYTDASAYNATGAGSWAAILVMPDGTEHEAHGRLKGEIGSSTQAEAMAVANALHGFLKSGLITEGAALRIVCDNSAVVRYLSSSGRVKAKTVREAITYIRQLQTKARLRLACEWIKGHQPLRMAASDPRIAYNRRCDKLAKVHSHALHVERRRERA